MPNVFLTTEDSPEKGNINQPQKPIGEQPGYKSLKDIVKRTLAEAGETSMTKYALFKSYGIDFLRDYYTMIGGTQNVITRELPVDNLKRVELPDDYINYVKIGIRKGDHVMTFLRDEELSLYTDISDCGVNQPNRNSNPLPEEFYGNGYFGPWLFTNYVNSYGEHTGGLYGYGNGKIKNGFTIDNGSIQLTSNIDAEVIYLEYVSSTMIYGEETYLPISAEEACKSYIRWKFELNQRQPKIGIVQLRQREYSNNVRIANRAVKPLTVEDITYAKRYALSMNVKF
jgi:hypothetical protein